LSQELLFYKELLPRAELLSENTPNCVSIQPDKNIAFLTMEYIHGRKPQIDDIDAIKKFQRKCIKISYKKMPYLRVFNIKGVSYYTSLFLIHSHNKPQRLPMEKLVEDIKLLHKLFIKRRVLKQINIKRDFVFQHGDFGPNNSKIDDEGKLMVYDWETYGLNIPGSDLLSFILVFTHDFNYIKEHVFTFLSDEGKGNYNAITCLLTLQYLNRLVSQPEGVRIQENWDHAIDYLKRSPLNN
jgi:thiamine kinase-like enzyme